MPIQIFADPPVSPPPNAPTGTIMPKVFCIKITDIRADKDDVENNKFTFEFEVLNWSRTPATDVHIALAMPDTSGVRFVADTGTVHDNKLPSDGDISDGVDEDGRPLYTAVDGNGVPIANEDTDGDGLLDGGEDIDPDDGGGVPIEPDGRLTNDLIPGNANIQNEFFRTEFSDTMIVWDIDEFGSASSITNDYQAYSIIDYFLPPAYAGVPSGPRPPCQECSGIDFIDLLGAAQGATAAEATQSVNDWLLSFLPPGTTIDAQGNVSPLEAIDDSVHNVRDGFVFTVDDFDDGDTFQINWFLTNNGNTIGTSSGGNDFGFGVINFARADGGNLPGPIFQGNSGFQQSQLVFFDSVFVVPDPAGMAMEPGAGLTAQFVESSDNIFGAPTNAVPIIMMMVGGGLMEIDRTPVLVAGSQQTAAWMIPVIVAGIGIAIVLARKF